MQSISQFLQTHSQSTAINAIVNSLAKVCIDISDKVRQGEAAGILGAAHATNIQGEEQKKLDVIANDMLKQALLDNPYVKGLASEEEALPVAGHSQGEYLVLFDPLDGSSNIDVNVTVGTIFSILKAEQQADSAQPDTYLQTGKAQVGAGYVLYGPSTIMVLTLGQGVYSFTLDIQKQAFFLHKEQIQIPTQTQEFAINMSNQRFWNAPMQRYVADLLQGEEGPLGKRYNMRWIASMVAEIHRIMVRGGIFMYPYDNREPHKPGKLRLMYEGNPMSMLVEQAGGLASTAYTDIMGIQPQSIHERVSVVMGSKEEVRTVAKYHQT